MVRDASVLRNPNTVADNEQDDDHDEQPRARHRQKACAQDAPDRRCPAKYTFESLVPLLRCSAALEFKEGQEAAGSAAKLGGEPMLARDV